MKWREGFFFQLSSEGFEIRKINDGLTAPIILLFLLNTLHALEIVGRKNARIFRHKFFSFNFLFPPPPPTPHPSPLISNFLFSLQINDLSDDFHFFTNVSFFISITKRKKKKFSRKERISVLKNPRIRGTWNTVWNAPEVSGTLRKKGKKKSRLKRKIFFLFLFY